MVRFKKKVVLITGAGSGIGQATAIAFAKEGARVAVNDVSAGAAGATARKIGKGAAVSVPGDVSRAEDCERMIRETVKKLGGLDILVNNAGIGSTGTVLTTDEATWDRIMAVNVKGVFLLSRAAMKLFVEKKRGVIVNTASIAGVRGIPDRLAYSTSKFAVVGLTKAMALDHVKDGVRVNCICPGTTETPWIQRRLAETPDPKATLAQMTARQPMGRLGRPEEMAAAILFLASDESGFTTGCAFAIDGGFSA